MGNLIAIAMIASLLGLAINKIVKEKKSGNKCIGCPHGKTCASNRSNLVLKK